MGCAIEVMCVVDAGLTAENFDCLDERIEELDAGGSPASSGGVYTGSSPLRVARRCLREGGADLLVKSADDNPFYLGVFDHLDWQLMRHLPVPVWFVRQRAPAVNRVLAAVGNSQVGAPSHTFIDHMDYAVLDTALQIGQTFGAGVLAAHAIDEDSSDDLSAKNNVLAYPGVNVPSSSAAWHNVGVSEHGRQIREFMDCFDMPERDLLVRRGSAEDALPALVDETCADLMVMGARPMARWQRLLGSPVAEPLLAESSCDVLVVKAARPKVEASSAEASAPCGEGIVG
jgi:nucleotide-binding universal stress UspA family protein